VLRALSPKTEDRWPDWEALQAELNVPKRAPLRVAAFAAIGIVVATGVGFYFYSRTPQPAPAPSSAAAPRQLNESVADESALRTQRASPADDSMDTAPTPVQPAETASIGSGEGAGSAVNAEQDARGQEIFAMACVACHGSGAAGAPALGDKTAWGPRIAQGSALLYERALQGYQGKSGFMPPKGGRIDLDDQAVVDAVDYMVVSSK
jgi:cytochrome c5